MVDEDEKNQQMHRDERMLQMVYDLLDGFPHRPMTEVLRLINSDESVALEGKLHDGDIRRLVQHRPLCHDKGVCRSCRSRD